MPVYQVHSRYRMIALDSLSAIYHPASGATHLVSEPVPQILEMLGNDRLGAAELLARLRSRFDVDADIDALTARVDELVELGLLIRQ